MCQYCDVRMPDGCGFELNSKNNMIELLIYPDGGTRVSYEDCNENLYHDTIKFSYCPMCGKPLHSSNEPVNEPDYYYLVRDDCGEYSIYDREDMAKEFAEEVAANVGVAELIRVKVDAVNACEVRCCWDDE